MSSISTVAQITRGFCLEAFGIGDHHWASFLVAFTEKSPWLCSLQREAEAWTKKKKNNNKRTHLLLVSAISLITPRHRKDAEVATALGHLSGFAQRNLKHLNLFDHSLILEEAVIYSTLAWYLSSDKLSLAHTHPRED